MRRLANLSGQQIVREICHPIGAAANVVRADLMRPGAGDDHFASFRLNFCGGRIVLFLLDPEVLFVPAVRLQGSGELIQLCGVNKFEGWHSSHPAVTGAGPLVGAACGALLVNTSPPSDVTESNSPPPWSEAGFCASLVIDPCQRRVMSMPRIRPTAAEIPTACHGLART